MRRINYQDVSEPFMPGLGERIFEMIGSPEHLGGTTSVSLAAVEVPPDGRSPRHYHRKTEEVYFCIRGHLKVIVDGTDHVLEPGTALLISPGEVHELMNQGSDDVMFVVASGPPFDPNDFIVDEDEDL